MDRFARIYALHNLLNQRRHPISRATLEEKLECSKATVERAIEDLRDYLGAPIKYDRKRNGYLYDGKRDHTYHLPGLWFNASELHALLIAQQLLANVQPGLLESHLNPLQQRIEKILKLEQVGSGDITQRVRILTHAARPVAVEHFQSIASALLQGQRITIDYRSRGNDEQTRRTLSPQRLVHYRDHWYLDAWCHKRQALRSFALDSIRHLKHSSEAAKSLSADALSQHFSQAYGIFAGQASHTAVLEFTARRARWVADEQWHPRQQGEYLRDGSYRLQIPYSNPTELVMDILKYGPDVQVIAPAELRQQIKETLATALKNYQ